MLHCAVLCVALTVQITLAEYEEVTVGFSGDPAEIVGVSFLQCTGEKPQILKVNLSSAGASVEVQDDRPGCLRVRQIESGRKHRSLFLLSNGLM